VSGKRYAALAGVRADAAVRVDDRDLASRGAAVGGEQLGERVRRSGAAREQSSAWGPYRASTFAWVATAPTPGRAHGTIGPTENQCDWTATPSSRVCGSRATIE
jgi:hypothetical protein